MARKYWLQLQLWLCFDSSLTWCIPSKKGQYDVAIFLISLLIVSKVVIRQCSTHSRWMWMKPAVVIADSLEWDRYDSLWIWWSTLSRHCQMQPAVVIADSFEWHRYDSLWIWRSTSSRHCHSPFFLTFSVFERMYQHSVKIMVCCWLVLCDSGPESQSVKFYRLQLWLRLQAKRSTLTNSNSGIDSDFAALVLSRYLSVFYIYFGNLPYLANCSHSFFGIFHFGCIVLKLRGSPKLIVLSIKLPKSHNFTPKLVALK